MDWGWIVAGLIWALPVIEALTDWDALVDKSREAGAAFGVDDEQAGIAVAVIATLFWPVTCIWAAVENVMGDR